MNDKYQDVARFYSAGFIMVETKEKSSFFKLAPVKFFRSFSIYPAIPGYLNHKQRHREIRTQQHCNWSYCSIALYVDSLLNGEFGHQ